ncbi:hypothetical protein VNI00_008636 [Paramarasmius palmivorus]|uniref:F-box domain-containing protein n=1 Tax=Paramarasmius palmivorus TaxID=297713 RepID=A0AAW0CTB0_9AGAR
MPCNVEPHIAVSVWHRGAARNQHTISNWDMQRNIDNTTTRQLKNTRTLQKPAQISNRNHNRIIPLARLPVEVIITIFEHCIGIDSSGHAFSKHAMPWVLSQVCSQWRSICLCTPSLWVIARVNTHLLDKSSCHDHSLNMLRAWLERSRPLPVSCIGRFDQEKPLSFHLQVLDLFIQESRRWSMVVFDLGTQAELYYRLSSVHPYLPLLHFCDIAVQFCGGDVDEPPMAIGNRNPLPSRCIWCTPRLRHFRFAIPGPEMLPPSFNMEIIPSSSTRLDGIILCKETPADFFDIIAPTGSLGFENLRSCRLSIVQRFPELEIIQSLTRTTLPRLQHLNLYGHISNLLLILDNLNLPSLLYLDIEYGYLLGLDPTLADRVLLAIGDLQARSRCHIKRLSAPFSLFGSPGTGTPTLVNGFGPVYELRVFINTEEEEYNQLAFERFSRRVGEMGMEMFDQVTTLHVLLCQDFSDDAAVNSFSSVVDMVESRLSCPLRRLERISFDSISDESEKLGNGGGWFVDIEPVDRILKLAQVNGIVLLGNVVDGEWVSMYNRYFWSLIDFEKDLYRWNRSGRCNWVGKGGAKRYLEYRELWESLWSANVSAGLIN